MNTSSVIELVLAPWKHVTTLSIGGITQVGFAEKSNILLVITHDGAGLFDCTTGERLAREYNYQQSFEESIYLTAKGIGIVQEQTIRVAGLFGGGFRTMTKDGWVLEVEVSVWPNHDIYLVHPWQQGHGPKGQRVKVATDGACELRAYGFADTDNTFVIATSCGIELFTR